MLFFSKLCSNDDVFAVQFAFKCSGPKVYNIYDTSKPRGCICETYMNPCMSVNDWQTHKQAQHA